MKKYRVYGVVTGSKYLGEVEAENAEEAEQKAFDELDIGCSLCHHCSSEAEDAEIHELNIEEVE